MSEYDPVESLRREVKRFCETNQFNAMNVTNFYLQARVVLNQHDQLRSDLERVTRERDELQDRVDRGIRDTLKILEERDQIWTEVSRLRETLGFYADWKNYSADYDTSQAGVSRRVILYSDQEEINEATIHAGQRARAALARKEEK